MESRRAYHSRSRCRNAQPKSRISRTIRTTNRVIAGTPETSIDTNCGTSAEYGQQVLAEKAPEEYKEVHAGKKSVNAALVAANLRKKKLQINKGDPQQTAKIIAKHFTKDQIEELILELKKKL